MPATSVSLLFPSVFPPSKYGTDDALLLNCLQYAMEHSFYSRRPYVSTNAYGLKEDAPEAQLFSSASGSEHEADYLTLHFAHHPETLFRDLMHRDMDTLPRDPKRVDIVFALFDVFLPQFVQGCPSREAVRAKYLRSRNMLWVGLEETTEAIVDDVMQLRRRLFRRSRAVAFMSGMHPRLGEQSLVHSLSDDLCKRILELSFAE